jgi:hypothetical protein
VLGRATGNSDTQDSPRPRLGGSHHLPPYNILYNSQHGPHPNGFFSWDSQVGGSLEIPTPGTLATMEAHNIACKPPITMRFEANL